MKNQITTKNMRIGFVFNKRPIKNSIVQNVYAEDLYAEFDTKSTVESIYFELTKIFECVDLIDGIFQLVEKLAKGVKYDYVFNISEGLFKRSRESQIPALLDAYCIPYSFSDPTTLGICLDKELTKQFLKYYSFPTTEYFMVNVIEDITKLLKKDLEFPLFAKPNNEGCSKGISQDSIINNMKQLELHLIKLFQTYNQPIIIEKFLSGREFTAGLIGNGKDINFLGATEIILSQGSHVYGFYEKENCELLIDYQNLNDSNFLATIENLSINVFQKFGCRDAARIDYKCDENGNIFVLEVNPLPGLHPTHSDLPIIASQNGILYSDLIESIILCSLKRNKGI